MSNPSAVILLSGGLYSATVLAIAMNQGFDVYAMSFRYGGDARLLTRRLPPARGAAVKPPRCRPDAAQRRTQSARCRPPAPI